MCSRTKGMPEATTIFSVDTAGLVYNQTNKSVYLGGNANHTANLSIEVNRHIRDAWYSFWKCTLELYDRSSALVKLKIRMLRAEVPKTMPYAAPTPDFLSGHADEDGK